MRKIGEDGWVNVVQHTIPTPYPIGDVHIYSCEINGAYILIDTGPPTRQALEYLSLNVDLNRLQYVFITHCHPDHCGQAKFLEEATSAKIIYSKYDTFKYERMPECINIMCEQLGELGFPAAALRNARTAIRNYHAMVPLPYNYLALEDSYGLLDSLGIGYIRCPGHTQSDIIYLLDYYAISGDVILREIFTAPLLEVDYDSFSGRFNNYKAYCETIPKIKQLEDKIILPSHRESIDSVDKRILFYVNKLIDRADTAGARIPEPERRS